MSYSIYFAVESTRSRIGARIKWQKLCRKWVALRENYFDVWCSWNIRVNRITNVQWWTRILPPVSISLFFSIPPPKKGKNKTKYQTVCVRVCECVYVWIRVRSCSGNVGGCAIKTFPRLIYCKYFLRYEKRWERKRSSLISEIVIARVAHIHIPLFYLHRREKESITRLGI